MIIWKKEMVKLSLSNRNTIQLKATARKTLFSKNKTLLPLSHVFPSFTLSKVHSAICEIILY